MKNVLTEVRRALRENVDEAVKNGAQRFFKETVTVYGVKSATVGKIARQIFPDIKNIPKKEMFKLCEDLWRSGYMEESWIACEWASRLQKGYEPSDFEIFRKWVDTYVDNWASCDVLCNHTIGTFVEMYPEFVTRLKDWTESSNRWMKRGSAVTLIIPARKGRFLVDILDIADKLISDRDDLVQKGYGWMLKAASEAHPDEVFAFLMERRTTMPRTAFRYALEKMPKERRAEAMKKGRQLLPVRHDSDPNTKAPSAQ